MDNTPLTARAPLDGCDIEISGNRISEQTLAIVSIAIPQGGEATLEDALKSGWSLDMPGPIVSTVSGKVRAVRTGPDQLFLIFAHDAPDAERVVQSKLEGAGYTTDQTDSWVQLRVTGPGISAALERLSPVDLSLEAFPIHASARTVFEHIGALAIRTGDDSFTLLSAASSARSFLHVVQTSFEYAQSP